VAIETHGLHRRLKRHGVLRGTGVPKSFVTLPTAMTSVS